MTLQFAFFATRARVKVVHRIKSEFERRQLKNRRYSMRMFSKHLGIEISMLSRVLQGKLPFTLGMLKKSSIALLLTPEEYLEYEEEILASKKNNKLKRNSHIPQLDQEEFKIIQDWYHFVILELTLLPDFEASAEWISGKLSISLLEAELALERLVKLELLNEVNGRIVASTKTTTAVQNHFSTIAMRNRQKQVLSESINAIDLVDINSRDHSAITIAFDSNLLPEVKERIKKFRRTLASFIDKKSKNKDNVYELSVSFFPWIK
jgi:uncharacterized protein (TIGR02147 family)